MVWLANYTSKGVYQAILSTTFTLLLSLFLPPVFWLNGAIVGFLFLTKSINDFLKVMVISVLVSFVVLEIIRMGTGIIILGLIILWTPIVVGGFFIKKYQSLSIGIELIALLALILILAVILTLGDLQAYWIDIIQQVIPADNLSSQEEASLTALLEKYSSNTNMTGWLCAGVLLGSVISLIVARFWQKRVQLKTVFIDEFMSLSFSKTLSIIGLGIFALGSFYHNLVLNNLNPVVIISFFFIGLSVAHTFITKKTNNSSWLVLFYFILVLMFPIVSLFLAVIGMTNYWFQYRRIISE